MNNYNGLSQDEIFSSISIQMKQMNNTQDNANDMQDTNESDQILDKKIKYMQLKIQALTLEKEIILMKHNQPLQENTHTGQSIHSYNERYCKICHKKMSHKNNYSQCYQCYKKIYNK